MATSGFPSKDEENMVANGTNWPLQYVPETKEHICGWCGQLLLSDDRHTQNIEVFEELQKMNQKFELLSADVSEMKKTEEKIIAELENNKKEFHKEILDLKAEIKKDLDIKCGETRVAVLSTVFKKVNVLEETMKEKMAAVNGKVSGVTETISTVVHSMLEVKEVTSSVDNNEPVQWKTEALWVQLKKSEEENKTTKTQLENEIEQLKTRTESFSDHIKTNGQDLLLIKKQMEDEITDLKMRISLEMVKSISRDLDVGLLKSQIKNERNEHELEKKKSFQVEPFRFDQLTIPMNCSNLVTHNYLFQPSYRWTITGIQAKLSQKTFELSSEMFQWNGYPVQARVKLQLKEDGKVYVSQCLEDESKAKDFLPIPEVFYLLKDKYARNPRHICQSLGYLSSPALNYSLSFGLCLGHKSRLNDPTYKLSDSVEIEVYVEPPRMTQQVHSYDGTLEWKIENYKRRLELEKNNLVFHQESPYFYTGPSGYRVQVRMYLNGFDRGGRRGPTAHILFLTGKFDSQLAKSFPHTTTLTLINRNDPEKSVSKTILEDIENQKCYHFEMCKFEEMENFIEDDVLFCKLNVESL